MKVNLHSLALAVSVTWLLMVLYPPWIGVCYDNTPASSWSEGYAAIFAPPHVLVKCAAHAHIDFVRLGVQFLLSLLVIGAFGRLTRQTWTNLTKTERLRADILTALCLASCTCILTTDAVSQLTPVHTHAVCICKPVSAGAFITTADCSMIFGEMPSDSVQNISDAVGHRAKQSLGYWAVLVKSDLQ